MAGKTSSTVFFRKGRLDLNERTDWATYRVHPAYELLSHDEFLRRFHLFRDAERKFSGMEKSFKSLVGHGHPVPVDLVEALECARVERDGLRNPLILANMKLVFKVASVYTGRGVEYVDLVQEGVFGLVRTLEKYKPEKGYRFSTYAAWWLRSMFSRSVYDLTLKRVARVPVHHQEQEAAVAREEAAFEAIFGCCPDDEELLAFAKQRGARMSGVKTQKKLHKLRLVPVAAKALSLDAPSTEDGERTFLDTQPSSSYSTESLAAARERLPVLEEEIRRVIEDPNVKNPERDTQMLRWRFGIDDGRPQTLLKVANAYQVSRERVRQIVAKRLSQRGLSERAFRAKVEDINTIREALSLVPES